MIFNIREVNTSSDLKRFLRFTDKHYKNCPQWVPGLHSDEKSIFTKSPCLDYCKLKMWIVCKESGEVAGRVAGIINPRYNEIYKTKRARFGWIEFEEDFEIAKLLLCTAENWAKSEGMEEIHGPLGYNTWYKQGMLVDGFQNTPQSNCIYNYPYYPQYIERLGYVKEADWIQYQLNASQGVSEKLKRISDMLLNRYPLKVVDIRELRRHADIADMFFKNYNETFSTVHNFVPLTQREVEVLGKKYINMLKPELNCFVMDDKGIVAAYGICFPSLSQAYKRAHGKLFPFGWFHILRGYFHYDIIDLMMVGADPHWKSKGVSAIFHNHLAANFSRKGIKYAITNPQIEDNSAVKVWDSYSEKELHARRRCYIKTL